MVSSNNFAGSEISSTEYFASEQKLGVSRSSLSEARAKIDSRCFEYLLNEVNQEAKDFDSLWRSRRVIGCDGSRLKLPHAKEILEKFPFHKHLGHYPQALLVTLTNVLTGVPIAANLEDAYASERSMLLNLLGQLNAGDLLLMDRGFDGFDMMATLDKRGFKFIVRTRTGECSWQAVKAFIRSNLKSKIVSFKPRGSSTTYKARLIKAGMDYKGRTIVLATNLIDEGSRMEIIELYLLRWRMETMYYRVKEQFSIEHFHARTLNGVLQEIWANLFTLAFTAMMVKLTIEIKGIDDDIEAPNFKNAVQVIRRNLRLIVKSDLNQSEAEDVIAWMIEQMARVICRKQVGRKNPRISKQSYSTWVGGKKNKDIARYRSRIGWSY